MDRKLWKNNEDKQKATTTSKFKVTSKQTDKKYGTHEGRTASPNLYTGSPRRAVNAYQGGDRPQNNSVSAERCRNRSFGRAEAARRFSPNLSSEKRDKQMRAATVNSDARTDGKRVKSGKSKRREVLKTPPSSGECAKLEHGRDEDSTLDLEDFILTTSNKVELLQKEGEESINRYYYDAWIDTTPAAVSMRSGDEEARRMIVEDLHRIMKRPGLRVWEYVDDRRVGRIKVRR